MIRRAIGGGVRLVARVAIALVCYDLAWPALSTSPDAATLSQVAGGVLAGLITILTGKFLYDTFLPLPRTP